MKNYKKENDFKRIGGITLVVFLCAVCTTTTLAAGEGFRAGDEKVFDDTKVMVEDEGAEDIEYEEDFISENENIIFYNQSGINLIDESGAIDSTSLEKGVTLIEGPVYAKKYPARRSGCVAGHDGYLNFI